MPVEIAVEVATSSLLFAFYSFSSKRDLDYASSQHGMNQYWFIINKKIQHILILELAHLVMGTIFKCNQVWCPYVYVRSCHQKKIVIERTRDLIYLKFVATDFFLKIISPSAGENSGDLA